MEAIGLQQHATYPTHMLDNILDLVFTELITQIHIKDLSCGSFLSDHCTVDFITTIPRDKPKTKSITYRNLKNINPEDMMKDIDAMQDRIQDGDLSDIINSLNSVLKDALDKHAPVITKTLIRNLYKGKVQMGITVTLRSFPGQAVSAFLLLFIVYYFIPHVPDTCQSLSMTLTQCFGHNPH